MALTVKSLLSVPIGDGSNNPIALGGALDIITAQGWLVNNGSTTLWLIAVGDATAKASPASYSIPVYANSPPIPLKIGLALSELGLLSETSTGSAFVIGK
jgi:hypothetical protein